MFKNKSENNSWKSYTDLVTGLLMIFIVISIVAFKEYNNYVGETEATLEQYEMIKKIDSTFRNLNEDSFLIYNAKCNQFELAVDVQFKGNGSTEIPSNSIDGLNTAGRRLSQLMQDLHEKYNVKFTVIIEGRAAKHLNFPTKQQNENANNKEWEYAMNMSYQRAYQLKKLWWKNNVLTWQSQYAEIIIAGSGFAGTCRDSIIEEKNKRFVIKVIPRFSPDYFQIDNN